MSASDRCHDAAQAADEEMRRSQSLPASPVSAPVGEGSASEVCQKAYLVNTYFYHSFVS